MIIEKPIEGSEVLLEEIIVLNSSVSLLNDRFDSLSSRLDEVDQGIERVVSELTDTETLVLTAKEISTSLDPNINAALGNIAETGAVSLTSISTLVSFAVAIFSILFAIAGAGLGFARYYAKLGELYESQARALDLVSDGSLSVGDPFEAQSSATVDSEHRRG